MALAGIGFSGGKAAGPGPTGKAAGAQIGGGNIPGKGGNGIPGNGTFMGTLMGLADQFKGAQPGPGTVARPTPAID